MSFFKIGMKQVIEILPCYKLESIYLAYSVSWLLIWWQHKEPKHQQLLYWPSIPWIIPEGSTPSSHMANSLSPVNSSLSQNAHYLALDRLQWASNNLQLSCPIQLQSIDFSEDQEWELIPAIHQANKSTLAQVMAWCRQATSHYLNQCWPRSLPPYGVTRPQRVKSSFSS